MAAIGTDYKDLLDVLVKQTEAGKIDWEETADEHTFLASVRGELTFEITRDDAGYELAVRSGDGTLLVSIESFPNPEFPSEREQFLRLRHVYELAKAKARDIRFLGTTLEVLKSL